MHINFSSTLDANLCTTCNQSERLLQVTGCTFFVLLINRLSNQLQAEKPLLKRYTRSRFKNFCPVLRGGGHCCVHKSTLRAPTMSKSSHNLILRNKFIFWLQSTSSSTSWSFPFIWLRSLLMIQSELEIRQSEAILHLIFLKPLVYGN